jgi:hypothetical protein
VRCSSQSSNGKIGHSFMCLFSFNLSRYSMGTELIKLFEVHNLASSFCFLPHLFSLSD